MENTFGSPSIKFIGTGGAFDFTSGNSSAVVRHCDKNFLIDCGNSVFSRLASLGMVSEIDGIFITHLHDDHVGSLTTLLFYRRFVLGKGPIPIYVPSDAFRQLLTAFFRFTMDNPSELATFHFVSELEGAGSIDTFGRHVVGMPTFAYYFQGTSASVVYSGDNGDADYLFGELNARNLPSPTVFHEIFFHSPIRSHTHYKDLMRWQDRYTIFGYHCDPGHSPADNHVELVAHHPELLY
jgi:ribonuclease BN (tRNA processing enzyme)